MNRNLQWSIFRAFFIVLTMQAIAAVSAEPRQCFIPRTSETTQEGAFVDPGSKVCRAFETELNRTCGGPIPIVEFQPSVSNRLLTLPDWHPIELYDKNGKEREHAFGLIAALVSARANVRYLADHEQRTMRDLERILERVRSANRNGHKPRFERATLDLEGRGKEEAIYRLYTGVESNPDVLSTDPNRRYGKAEPEIFLDRTTKNGAGAGSGHAYGLDVAHPSDVVIADGVPHLLRWDGERLVLVYATYLYKDIPPIPGLTTYIIPTLQCLFEYQPQPIGSTK